MTEPTQEQPQVTATVSPAPPPRSRWDAIPHHLGRARTSTVVLSVLFLAIGALWLNIRPDPVADPSSTRGPAVEQPVVPVPTTPPPAPDPTTAPAPTTSDEPEPTSAVPTTTAPEVSPTETSPRSTPTPTEEPAPLPEPTGTPTG